MKRSCAILTLLLLALASGPLRAQTDTEVAAHRVALDLAGAFSNDGFKIRDGYWSGAVKPGEPAVIAVNLYAGNQYWFSVGAEREVKKFTVQIYDENGRPMETEPFQAEDKAAAGFSPVISGQYFVSIAPLDSEAATTTFCLVYSYK